MKKDKRNIGAIDYFHRNIETFDNIYTGKRGRFYSTLDNFIRASVKARFNLAFEMLGDLGGKSVLDIGCGSGRYMFRAAQNNADYIAGIDAAPGALEEARKIATDLGIEKKMEFIEGDFLERVPDRKFEVIFAVGYFDYIFNPGDHLKQMVEISDGFIYASFPKRWTPLTVTRKIRLTLNHCPVRFYSKKSIYKVLREVGVENFELKSIFRDYILIIRK
jgi:SAM-dependent methyltransferase